MIKNKEELIEYYTKRLEKVKIHHDPEKAISGFLKEKCDEYIKFAEKELEAVKQGRNW